MGYDLSRKRLLKPSNFSPSSKAEKTVPLPPGRSLEIQLMTSFPSSRVNRSSGGLRVPFTMQTPEGEFCGPSSINISRRGTRIITPPRLTHVETPSWDIKTGNLRQGVPLAIAGGGTGLARRPSQSTGGRSFLILTFFYPSSW